MQSPNSRIDRKGRVSECRDAPSDLANDLMGGDFPVCADCWVATGGVNMRGARGLSAALKTLLENLELRREMGQRNHDRIAAEWNYEPQFAPVLEMLD